MSATEEFRQFITRLCDTDPGPIVADGRWHRFRISDTRHKGSKPGRYLMHADGKPNGVFMDWRDEQKRHRWRSDGPAEHIDRDEIARRRKARQDRLEAEFKAASERAKAYWATCTPINGASHPYLERKGIAPFGARYGSGKAFGLGDDVCVIVPIVGPDGKPLSLQAIRADGERRFFPGTTKDGGYFLIGPKTGDGPVVYCEGYATGASIHAATGYLVVVCLSAGNMRAVSLWAMDRFAGREMIVAGDDDWHLPQRPKPLPNEGREAALLMGRNLGARVVFPDMQGLVTDGGDDFNDQAREYGLEDVARTISGPAPDERPTVPLRVICPSDWQGTRAPLRDWRLKDLIPNYQATLFTGAGAVGKSLATQQMSTCVALGLLFLGVETQETPALYVTCEDDEDELHRRQEAICQTLKVGFDATYGRLFLLSLHGELGNELGRINDVGALEPSPRYDEIVATCRALGVRHLTLDNSAHFFTGNENDRHEVAAFISLLNRLARDIGGSVVLVGHPNKAGDSYSGSTAWENQVRSRLFMETPAGEDGTPANPDMRVIRNEKANYARRGSEVRFFWQRGAFTTEEDMSPAERDQMAGDVLRLDDELFLRLLDQLTSERRNTSHARNSANFAPKLMSGMTAAQGVPKERLRLAMERLFDSKTIAASQPLWLGQDRHPVLGIARVAQSEPVRDGLREGAGTSAGSSRSVREGAGRSEDGMG